MGKRRRSRLVIRAASTSADEAIEAAAIEFKTDVKKLIAVPAYEVAQ